MRSSRVVVLFTLVTILMASVSILLYIPSTTSYSPYNPYPDGLSGFMDRYDVSVCYSKCDLDKYDYVILLLDKPISNFSRYVEYVSGGGNLIILDSDGYSNDLLSKFGLDVEIYNVSILDEISKYGDRFHVKAEVVYRNYSIGLYKPSYIEVNTLNVDVIASSSIFSYLDLDGDGNYTIGEPIGSMPIAVKFSYRLGSITLISDKNFICNRFIDKGINIEFLDESLSGNILLDLSNTRYSGIDYVKLYLSSMSRRGFIDYLYALLLTILTVVGVVVSRGIKI